MSGSVPAVSPESFRTFGELLRFLRKRAELSQRELALQVGYHYSYMSRIESEEHVPDTATLMARFVPALGLEGDPEWTERLLKLATSETKTMSPRKGTQATASNDPEIDPPAPGMDMPRSIFPASLTPLLGREQEVPTIMKTLLRFDLRLVTLVGPPGIGKTRLAIQVALDAENLFAHGMKFIDLAPVTHPEGFLASIAQELGVIESPDIPLINQLIQALRQKNMLLVVDNFEHLIEAAPQFHQLLSGAAGVKALVTSRVPLHITGETQFSVPPLALPQDLSGKQSDVSERELLEYAAIRLFVERASAIQAGFKLTPENAEAVCQICRRLDGLPLAIELAAVRIKVLSPQSMLKEFDRRFDWLAPNNREGQASKQTLRGTIEWSYNLLSEKEQILFRRLSVFSGGRSMEAVEAVCSDDGSGPSTSLQTGEIFDLMIQLTDQSLLFAELQNEETRFSFLETIHDFAREKLNQSGEEAEIRNRHLAYFCKLAERIEVEIEGANQIFWANRGEAEHANMRTAMEWSLKEGADLQNGIRLASNLGLFWFLHNYFIEGLYWFKIFLPKAEAISDESILAKLLFRTADLHLRRAELNSALVLCSQSVALCRKINNKLMLAMALYILADTHLALQDLKTARESIEECIALSSEVNYPAAKDIALILFGKILHLQGDTAFAHARLHDGLTLAVQLSDYWGNAEGHRILGDIFMKEGNFEEARKNFERGTELFRSIGDKFMAATMMVNLAVVTNLQGQYIESGRYAEEAFSIFQAVGDELHQPLPLRMMGYAAVHAGNLVRARVLLHESLKASRTAGDVNGQLASVSAIAWLLTDTDPKKAITLCALIETRANTDGIKLPEPDLKVIRELLEQGKSKLGEAGYRSAYEANTSLVLDDEIMKLISG